MTKLRPVYIYCHVDPVTLEIRYVGYTVRTPALRLKGHLNRADEAKKGTRVPTHHDLWLNTLSGPPLVEVLEITTEDSADERERFWIAYMRELGCDLTNKTDGGKGRLGEKQSAKEIEKRAAKMRGRKQTPEQIKKSSEARRGKKRTAEARQKMREAKLGTRWSEARRAAEEALKSDPERSTTRRKKHSASGRAMVEKVKRRAQEDPEFAKQLSNNSKYKMHIRWHVNAGKTPQKSCAFCKTEETP